MKTKPTPRQKAVYERNKAMGPALIVKPLRFIADRTVTIVNDEAGRPVKSYSWEYAAARVEVDLGNGAYVAAMARRLS